VPRYSAPSNPKETDLIYEGIATAMKARRENPYTRKETDLIYEGIATQISRILSFMPDLPSKKLT